MQRQPIYRLMITSLVGLGLLWLVLGYFNLSSLRASPRESHLSVLETTTISHQMTLSQSMAIIPPQSLLVQPGQTVTITHQVVSNGLQPMTTTLNVTVDSQGWSYAWQAPSLLLTPDQSVSINLVVNVPADATVGATNLLTVTAQGANEPNLMALAVDALSVAPLPKMVQNPITGQGVASGTVTMPLDSTVTWLNQTSEPQQLIDCNAPFPGGNLWYYLPLILRPINPDLSLPSGQLSTRTTSPISATILPNESYTRTFTTAGTYTYCVTSQFDHLNQVLVMPNPTPDFAATLQPNQQTITQGQATAYTLHLNALNGLTESLTLTMANLPPQLDVTLSANVTEPTAQVTLDVTSHLTTPVGLYPLTVVATTASLSQTIAVTLVISPAVTPPLPTPRAIQAVDDVLLPINEIRQGDSISFKLLLHPTPGTYTIFFNDGSNDILVGLVAVDEMGNGVSPAFNIPPSTQLGGRVYKSVDENGTTMAQGTLIVTQAASPEFAITMSPLSQTAVVGQLIPNSGLPSLTYTVDITPLVGVAEPVNLSVLTVPIGTVGTLGQSSIFPPGQTVLTLTAVSTTYIPFDAASVTILAQTALMSQTVTSQANITPDGLDVVVVFDKSGSTEFDSRCYGCWKPRRVLTPTDPNYLALDSLMPESFTYPGNGIIYPVNYAQVQNLDICNPTSLATAYETGGHKYMVIEAELFSNNDPILNNAFLQQGKTHWVMNRGQSAYGQEYNDTPWADGTPPFYDTTAFSVDPPPAVGVHMTHMPEVASIDDGITSLGQFYSLADAQAGNAPRLEYDFKFRGGGWGTTAKIWVRMHGGRGPMGYTGSGGLFWFNNDGSNRRTLYWGLASEDDDKNDDGTPDDPSTMAINHPAYLPNNIQAIPLYFTLTESHTQWHWREIGTIENLNPDHLYRLYLYAGSAGFSIDRIVITNNTANVTNETQANNEVPAAIRDGSQLATGGSGGRAACDPCNPIYGHNIVANGSAINPGDIELSQCTFYNYTVPINQADWRVNPIFSDFENPLRILKEAVKHLALGQNGLDPTRDQLGIVPYNHADSYLDARTELDCLSRLGSDQCAANNFAQVLADIEAYVAGGATSIGAGMKDAFEVLGIDIYNEGKVQNACNGAPCSRGMRAQKVMIVITDGEPNENPGGACIDAGGPVWSGNTNAAHRCPLWFAQQAAYNGIDLYVIGVGQSGLNQDYLRTMAEIGNGQFYYSATGADLNQIFDQVKYSR